MNMFDDIFKVFNDQIIFEFIVDMIYCQLVIEVDVQDFFGMVVWLCYQVDEEIVYVNKFIDYIFDCGSYLCIGIIEVFEVEVGFFVFEIFQVVLVYEEKVFEVICEFYCVCILVGDIDVILLLQWFINEQIEEEVIVDEIVGCIEFIGDDGLGLFCFDVEFGFCNVEFIENEG